MPPALLADPRPPLRMIEGGALRAGPGAKTAWIEVTIAWEDTTLHVAHVRAGERFVLAENVPRAARGFAVPRGTIGAPGGELLVDHHGQIAAMIPDDARATFVEGGRVRTRVEAMHRGTLVRSDEHDAWIFELHAGRRCRFAAGALRVEIAVVEPGVAVGKPIVALRKSHWAILAISAMLHAIVLAAILGLPSASASQPTPASAPRR